MYKNLVAERSPKSGRNLHRLWLTRPVASRFEVKVKIMIEEDIIRGGKFLWMNE